MKCPEKPAEPLQWRTSLKGVRDFVSLHVPSQITLHSDMVMGPLPQIHPPIHPFTYPSNHPQSRYVPRAYNVQGTIYPPTWASGGDGECQWGAGEGQEVRG